MPLVLAIWTVALAFGCDVVEAWGVAIGAATAVQVAEHAERYVRRH